jgi:hypothetical protein
MPTSNWSKRRRDQTQDTELMTRLPCANWCSFDDHGRSGSVSKDASKRLEEIEEKQRELQSLHDELAHLVTACRGDHMPDCPIIDYLG